MTEQKVSVNVEIKGLSELEDLVELLDRAAGLIEDIENSEVFNLISKEKEMTNLHTIHSLPSIDSMIAQFKTNLEAMRNE